MTHARSSSRASGARDSWPASANGLPLGYLTYRSTLVPPHMALLGLIRVPSRSSPLMILTGVYKNGEGPPAS